jgi:hypothetical protein
MDAIKNDIINTLQKVKRKKIHPDKFIDFFKKSMPERKITLELNNVVVDDKDVFQTNFYYDYFFNIDGIRYLITILYNFNKTEILQIIYKNLDKPLMYYIDSTNYLNLTNFIEHFECFEVVVFVVLAAGQADKEFVQVLAYYKNLKGYC